MRLRARDVMVARAYDVVEMVLDLQTERTIQRGKKVRHAAAGGGRVTSGRAEYEAAFDAVWEEGRHGSTADSREQSPSACCHPPSALRLLPSALRPLPSTLLHSPLSSL